MLKEVGASGQISLGKKYAGQLFDLTVQADGCIVMQPVRVVPVAPSVQEQPAVYNASLASPAEVEAARAQWEEENKQAIEAFNTRMRKVGSMGRQVHEWRKAKAQGS